MSKVGCTSADNGRNSSKGSAKVSDEGAARAAKANMASQAGSGRKWSIMTALRLKAVEEQNRVVQFGGEAGRQYCDNFIKTSKYTLINFLPRSIFEQFRRLGNQYFLLLVILMMLGTYTSLFESPIGPSTTLGPLILVLAVSMTQEGYTDFKRHRSDDETNNRKSTVLNGAKEDTKWKDIRVGNMLLIRNGNPLPADVVVLATSEEDGICYVETSQIDGETNLKLHRAPVVIFPVGDDNKAVLEQVKGACAQLKGEVECEPPNLSINTFTGVLKLPDRPDPIPLGPENVMLRGAALRNTDWAVGAVVYTGVDTKIMRNSRQAPSKLSGIDKGINSAILLIFLTDLILVTISAFLLLRWENRNFAQATYLGYFLEGESDQAEFDRYNGGMDFQTSKTPYYQGWLTFLVLYNNFIPISMYVTVEMVVFALLYFVNMDLKMYREEEDMPAKARSSNITDLGQIQYVFSDKTGTLTQNVMRFKRASCGGQIYGAPVEIAGPSGGSNSNGNGGANGTSSKEGGGYKPLAALADAARAGEADASGFLDILSLAHSVVVETKKEAPDGFVYQAESPDEGALVDAAKDLGYKLLGRNSTSITTQVDGETRVAKVLAVNKFDSDRKRQSIILERPDGSLRLLCKGADSSMVGPEQAANAQEPNILALHKHLEEFACEGLRTLVLGVKDISKEEWNTWRAEYKAAQEALTKRDEKLTAAANLIEKGMTIVGATAIEDKLQDGVPDTIACLALAGIKLWVLTGDKRETAINIGFSCKVLTPKMDLKVLVSGPKVEVRRQLAQLYKDMVKDKRLGKFASARGLPGATVLTRIKPFFGSAKAATPPKAMDARMEACLAEPPTDGYVPPEVPPENLEADQPAFIMEGPALINIFGDTVLESMLFQVASQCNAVIACRVSPKQKAILVRMVKQYVKPTPVTLSIGDGANDVPMLQEAQVGVGISGKEGQQAVNNSDFAVAQFRFLKDLLLVHGRWNYRRLSTVVLYSFFKNTVLVVCLFLYNFKNGFSGTPVFEDNMIALYNFFLGLPIIMVGIFERDVTRKFAMDHPELYYIGREGKDLNARVDGIWILFALICGLLTYYIPLACYATNYGTTGAVDLWGLDAFGTVMLGVLVIAMNWKVLLETRTITYCSKGLCGSGCKAKPAVYDSDLGRGDGLRQEDAWTSRFGWTIFILLGSIAFYFLTVILYSDLMSLAWPYYWSGIESFGNGVYWLMLFLVPTTIALIDVAAKFLNQQFSPSLMQLGVEQNRLVEGYIQEEDTYKPMELPR
eukprot:TRINITY_DN6635_c0_g2_i1.p1 TRINITY_DN6635_c0_g2~~TRINITY_DN6635_c0_g2_i1.p1  ORF type:complete len:1273 (-),score=466.48 TRINITY_DN6635_c0_g2_i1:176-3994(-)